MTINRNLSIIPAFLQEGDQVEVVGSSRHINRNDINYAIQLIKDQGFIVKIHNNIFIKKSVFAGEKKERIDSIQKAFDDPSTKAIFFTRGGYGAIQVIDYIDFTEFIKYPKWLIGFSDVTIFLIHTYAQYKIASIHGPMLFNFQFTQKTSIDRIFKILTGTIDNLKLKSHLFNQLGASKGTIIGGNLSILCSLIGSNSFIDNNQDYILFIEDVDEYLYHLERMMYVLERGHLLKNIKGLIIGQMTNMLDNKIAFGQTPYEIIHSIVKKYNYPICFNFPVGHTEINNPIIVGANIDLVVGKTISEIKYK